MIKDEENELITLSDLNREDNIKYISSEAQGIAITLDRDRYAPTFCKLERAYICGRRKSEKQIEDLEETINKLHEQFALRYDLEDKLEQENAELKEQNKNYEQLIDNGSVTLAKERLKNYKQLTKVRGLLRAWFQYCIDTEGKTPLKIETAQFLKEIEKCLD